MTRFKIFQGKPQDMETAVNAWLEEHPTLEILHTTSNDYLWLMIFYRIPA